MVENAHFSEAGAVPWDAAHWVRTVQAVPPYAAFQDAASPGEGVHAHESFVWHALLRTSVFTSGVFDARSGSVPKIFEDFEDLWGARVARLITSKQVPYVLQPGMTLEVRVHDRPAVTITFQAADFANIADARAEEVARVIDRQLVDADAFMSPGGREVVVATTAAGFASSLEVLGGTANAALGFPTGRVAGRDEEGGTFYRRAEYDFLKFRPDTAEFDTFTKGWPVAKVPAVHDDAAVPDMRVDPGDKRGRLTLLAAEPFLPSAFLPQLVPAVLGSIETFQQAGYPGETLTLNW